MATLLPNVKQRFFDANGLPLAGGKLYSYAAGTTTPLATYTSATESATNSNPTILDANGEANVWIGQLAYKFVLKDASDIEQWTVDGVTYLTAESVTTGKIADGAVTNDKIADGSISEAKLTAKNIITQPLTIGSVTSTTPTPVTGTVSFQATGRPVVVQLVGEELSSVAAALKVATTVDAAVKATIEIWRNGTKIDAQTFGLDRSPATALLGYYNGAGTYSYTSPIACTLLLEGAGGGGGGGGGAGNPNYGSGGGGGGGSSAGPMLPVVVGAGDTLNITVGAGGGGGSGGVNNFSGTPGSNGSAGSDTYVTIAGMKVYAVAGGSPGAGAPNPGSNSGQPGGAGGAGGGLGGTGGTGGTNGSANNASPGGRALASANYSGGNAGASNTSFNAGGGGGGASSLFGKGGDGGNAGGGGGSSLSAGTGGGGGGGGLQNGPGGAGGSGTAGFLRILNGASGASGGAAAYAPASAFRFVDLNAPAGQHYYTVQAYVSSASATLTATGKISLQVYEL